MQGGPASSPLSVAPTDNGCCVRVEGRGTMRHSPAALDVALNTLRGHDGSVVVFDLTACDYLDSTFLGCLTQLYRQFGTQKPSRFLVAAPPERRKRLMGASRLDLILPMTDAPPPPAGPAVALSVEGADDRALGRHVMECHAALAGIDSPMRPVFARIAEQLQREMSAKAPGPDR